MSRFLSASRYLVLLAVASALVGSAVVLIYGVIVLANLVVNLVQTYSVTNEAMKGISLNFIQLIDLLFLGVALYIVALGLYHLFVDTSMVPPRWLKIDDFDELKLILLSVVILILVINFTGVVLNWDGGAAILELGLAVAAVIASLGLIMYIRVLHTRHPEVKEKNAPSGEESE